MSDVERISMQGPFEPNCSGCGEFIQEDQVIYARHEGPPGVWGNAPWCRACYMRTYRPEATIAPAAGPASPLRWTAEPPRKPGFFWVRVRGGAPRLCEFRWGEDLGREPNPAISYAGPIPEPLDADEPDAPTLRDEAAAVLDAAAEAAEAACRRLVTSEDA